MSPTTEAVLAALIGAIVAGGSMLAWHLSERTRYLEPPMEEPVLPPAAAQLLSVLRSSAVVVNDEDAVVKASAPAIALGVVREGRLASPELADLVHAVRRDGQIREAELEITRPLSPPKNVSARIAPLGSRLVLALLEDRTRERRVEAVRRDFVGNVSHELKTPVGALRLLSEAVSDASDDPEAVRRFAGRMQTECERLTRLVQQIIELSRLQGDDPVEAPRVIPVDRIVHEAVDNSTIEARARDVTVVTGGESGLLVFGNAEQITTAVSNLVANAVAYSETGSSVLVNTKSDEQTVSISVVDQGIGIPEPELERIFERFYRVDPARHRATGGTGLGLSIVKHVAATHGGDVRVWSVEGQGSTFTLTLPRRKEQQ